jgi:1,2-diacylglycerol 3-alpha-glucosyltransferase
MKIPIKTFIVCTGLGKIQRGFESFSQECFDALSQESSLDITLFKGGGNSDTKSITLPNLPRNDWLTIQLAKLIRRSPYFIEQTSFTLNLLSHLHQQQPDVIYFSDGTVGNLLWHWRNLTKQTYKLLYSNGGPLNPPFPRWDCIQQLTPAHFKTAIDAGEPPEKQILLPYGLKMPAQLSILSKPERSALRLRLGLPENRPILLSVGAINNCHKRMNYLIRELAALPPPRPYLILLGQLEAESPKIIHLARELLGEENFQVKTVSSLQVSDYYKVADTFVLTSLKEGFGRVFLEAMAHGLPCLAHDYETSRFILRNEGYFGNFQLNGNLANLLLQFFYQPQNESKQRQRHQSIYTRFSWESLRHRYVEMIERTTN